MHKLTWSEDTVNIINFTIFDADECSTIRNVAWSEPLITMDYLSGSPSLSIPVVSTLTQSPSWCPSSYLSMSELSI